MDIDQPTGNKRSLPDSFLTHSPPPSPLESYGNSKAMPAPQNPVTLQNEIIEKKKKKNKKSKSAALTTFLENIDAYIEPAKKLFTDQNNFKIDFITFKHVIENNQGHFEPPTIYNEYKISKEDLLEIIMSIKPILQNASGGISTFIKDSYSSEEILINTPLESVTISIQLKQKITICNFYLSNQSPFTEADLKNIIQQLPPPFILLGDFNSHNKLWGCISTNTRGKIIESVIDSENLITLNNGRPTHFGTASGTQSAIDLTFTTPSFAPHLTWDTLSHPYGSDHLPIITKLTYRNTEDIQVGKPKWKLNTADWNLFTSLLEQKIDSFEFENPKINNLNEVTQNFTNAILEIANLTIGQTIFSGRKPPVPWWNSHCNESIKSKKTAFNKFKRTKSQDDFIEFKKRRAQARRTIKDSKTSSWRAYTSSINSKANPKQIWNKIKAFKCINKYNIQILKNENHTIHSEPSEIANELGSFFSKASSTETYPLEFQRYKCSVELCLDFF
ncbi:hypothetical protein QTP88_021539 [Uroleucon formosanum]